MPVWRQYMHYLLGGWCLSVTINNTDRYRVSNPALNSQYDEIRRTMIKVQSGSCASTQRLLQAPFLKMLFMARLEIRGYLSMMGYPMRGNLNRLTPPQWYTHVFRSIRLLGTIEKNRREKYIPKRFNSLKAYPAVLSVMGRRWNEIDTDGGSP